MTALRHAVPQEMDPEAAYDALNNLALAVLFSEREPDEERRRMARQALTEASVGALTVFPDDTAEGEALAVLVDAVAAFTRQQEGALS